MAKFRDILMKLEVRTSRRANTCKRNSKHKIPKGDLWLIVTPRIPNARDYGYCVGCGIAMIETAQTSLAAHLAALQEPAEQ